MPGRDLTLYIVTKDGQFSIPVENDDGSNGYTSATGNVIHFPVTTDPANGGARFGFAGAGVGFDQRPFAPATYPTRREIFTGLSTGDLLIIAFAGPQRHELQAVGIGGGRVSTAVVQARMPNRGEVAAESIRPSGQSTAEVGIETAGRHEVSAEGLRGPPVSTVRVRRRRVQSRRLRLIASAHRRRVSTAIVQARGTNRHPVEAASLYAPRLSTAGVQVREANQHEVAIAPNVRPVGISTAVVQAQTTDRHDVEATSLHPPGQSTARVRLRTARRRRLRRLHNVRLAAYRHCRRSGTTRQRA